MIMSDVIFERIISYPGAVFLMDSSENSTTAEEPCVITFSLTKDLLIN